MEHGSNPHSNEVDYGLYPDVLALRMTVEDDVMAYLLEIQRPASWDELVREIDNISLDDALDYLEEQGLIEKTGSVGKPNYRAIIDKKSYGTWLLQDYINRYYKGAYRELICRMMEENPEPVRDNNYKAVFAAVDTLCVDEKGMPLLDWGEQTPEVMQLLKDFLRSCKKR